MRDASTDNTGVTGYEVFRNGVSIGNTATEAMARSGSSARHQTPENGSGWSSEHEVEIYPNPVTHYMLTILLHADRNENTEVRLASIQGTESLSLIVPVHDGENVISIPVSTISDGIYILTVRSPAISLIEKVIIRRIP